MTKNSGTKEAILMAAAEVTSRLGSSSMTLEAVAKQAKVSKGGLLYHFPTKEALVQGMLARLIEEFDESINIEIQREISELGANLPGRWHRAYVRASITPPEEIDGLMCSMLVAFAFDPTMLESIKELSAKWIEMAENDGICLKTSKIVRLAADGYWYSRLFQFEGLYGTDDELPGLREKLFELIDNNVDLSVNAGGA